MTIMIAVDWYGPFSSILSARTEALKAEATECLYLGIHRLNRRAYIGITSSVGSRLTDNHHILGGLEEGEADIWIGQVSSHAVAGRGNGSFHTLPLTLAEHMLAYFLELSENDRKRRNPPKRSAKLLNRWFGPNEPYKRRFKRPAPVWPDYIEFNHSDDGENGQMNAKIVWFGGKQSTLSHTDIIELCERQ